MWLSRVKILSGVLFEVPFDFDRFKHMNSAVSVDRGLDYTVRTNQLITFECISRA